MSWTRGFCIDLSDIDREIEFLTLIKEIMEKDIPMDSPMDTIIYMYYIKCHGKLQETYKRLKEEGYRNRDFNSIERIYQQNDISDCLWSVTPRVSKELNEIVKRLFHKTTQWEQKSFYTWFKEWDNLKFEDKHHWIDFYYPNELHNQSFCSLSKENQRKELDSIFNERLKEKLLKGAMGE